MKPLHYLHAFLLCSCLGLIVLWFARYTGAPASRGGSPRPERLGDRALPGAKAIETRRKSIEKRQRHWDDTVWKDEILAQRYGAVWTRFWDALKSASDPLEVFSELRFGQINLPRIGQSRSVERGIKIRPLDGPVAVVGSEEWRRWMTRFRLRGLVLDQSEWRQVQFWPLKDGAPRSTVAFAIHARQPKPEERFVLRGTLEVRWAPASHGQPPIPEVISLRDCKLLSRRGPPPFDHVVAADVTPMGQAQVFEPNLQVFDLDGNGLSEILASRINRVYWNRGRGKFSVSPLFDFPLHHLANGLLADFDGDGITDYLAVNSGGLALFQGAVTGRFSKPPRLMPVTDSDLANPFLLTAGDIDRDGDLDLWLAQYRGPYQDGQMPTPYYDANDAFPSYLLVNNGHGVFQDQTERAGLAKKRYRRTYSGSFVDFDGDGDLDLVVISDFAGIDLYRNDGTGHFKDATARLIEEPHAFGMAHSFGDYDGDGQLDLLMIGMNSPTASRLDHLHLGIPEMPDATAMRGKMAFGNRLFFQRQGRFIQTNLSRQIAQTGWSWGVTSLDFDNDGDLDIYIGNGHITGRSTRDYEREFWLHDLYLGNSREDPVLDAFLLEKQNASSRAGDSFGGNERNRFFLNLGGREFIEAGYLLGVSLGQDTRNVVSEDLDGDGRLELIVTTFESWPETRQVIHLFPNFTEPTGHWIGVRLHGVPGGPSPIGATVNLVTPSGRQSRWIVTGDSYRSQHPWSAHFGLGNEDQVKWIEVRWPAGARSVIRTPAVDRYYEARPEKGTDMRSVMVR